MARYNAIEVYDKMGSKRVLPLFNYADTEVCKSVMRVCYAAGVRVFELTNRDSAAFEVFKNLVPFVEKELPELSLGAGTILDVETAQKFIDAGADFIIAPNLDAAVGKVCTDNDVPWIPGCFTPTEMKYAYDLGAEVVKLFPAGTVGPSYIKHIKGPLSFLKIIVTGGVELDEVSLAKWIEAGVFAIGVGSQLFNEKNIKSGNYTEMENQISYLIQFTRKKEER
jgi:2-dehydro-3-deoxyphosphogluconate aldolase / (4S)-4-hydroxy-2-oxoglutarate aldolase